MYKWFWAVLVVLMLVFLSACASGVETVEPSEVPAESTVQEEVVEEEAESAVVEGEEDPAADGDGDSEMGTPPEEEAGEAAGASENERAEGREVLAVGEKIPDFTLIDADGNMVQLSDYEGQMVMMTFWTTWCTYCKQEMPLLEDVNSEVDDLVVIGINVQETPEQVKVYAEENGLTFDMYMDEEGEMAQLFMVSGFPTSYFVNADGILVGGLPGYVEREDLMNVLDYVRTFDPEADTEN